MEDYADWLHWYVLKQGYKAPVLVGHSLGGAIVQTYTLRYPEDVKVIILIATGARLRVHPDYLAIIGAGIAEPAKWLREFIEPIYAHVAPDFRTIAIKNVTRVGAAVQLNDFLCCHKWDVMDKVSGIKVPALVICGDEDRLTPVKFSQYLVDKIIGARLVIINGATHHVFMEKPEEVNQAIEQFLATVS